MFGSLSLFDSLMGYCCSRRRCGEVVFSPPIEVCTHSHAHTCICCTHCIGDPAEAAHNAYQNKSKRKRKKEKKKQYTKIATNKCIRCSPPTSHTLLALFWFVFSPSLFLSLYFSLFTAHIRRLRTNTAQKKHSNKNNNNNRNKKKAPKRKQIDRKKERSIDRSNTRISSTSPQRERTSERAISVKRAAAVGGKGS